MLASLKIVVLLGLLISWFSCPICADVCSALPLHFILARSHSIVVSSSIFALKRSKMVLLYSTKLRYSLLSWRSVPMSSIRMSSWPNSRCLVSRRASHCRIWSLVSCCLPQPLQLSSLILVPFSLRYTRVGTCPERSWRTRETSALVQSVDWNHGFLDLFLSHPVAFSWLDFSMACRCLSVLLSMNAFTSFLYSLSRIVSWMVWSILCACCLRSVPFSASLVSCLSSALRRFSGVQWVSAFGARCGFSFLLSTSGAILRRVSVASWLKAVM